MKDIHITTNKDGIHVEKPTSASDIMDYVKQYGFFLYTWFLHHCLSIVIKTC